jgi:hypothetical protein
MAPGGQVPAIAQRTEPRTKRTKIPRQKREFCASAIPFTLRVPRILIRRSGPPEGWVPAPSHVPLTALLITNGDAGLCIRMRWRNSLTSADPGVGQPTGLRVVHPVRHGAGRPPPQQGRAHIDGGAARLTEARVSIMQCKTKRRPGTCAAERRRAAPDMRPGKISASTFRQVRAIQGNGLRSRERRFESC